MFQNLRILVFYCYTLLLVATEIHPTCGEMFRIVKGMDTPITEAPYMMEVIRYEDEHICGGTLVSVDNVQVVVSAAHCMVKYNYEAEDISISAGSIYLAQGELRKVRKIVVHDGYDGTTVVNDISLLFLETNFDLSESIATADLPAAGSSLPAGNDVFVTGWGHLEDGGDYYADSLQGVLLPVISNEECQTLYKDEDKTIFDTVFCTYVNGMDACQGDSGGPAVVKDGSNTTLVGVVSWGTGCAEEGHPGVFTRVSGYVNWIKEQVAQNKQ